MTSGQMERAYPLFFGVLSTVVSFVVFYKLQISIGDSIKDLFSSVINVGAITTGFLGTMQSILLTSERRRVVKYLKEANKFNSLVKYLLGSITLCIAIAAFSGAVLFLENHKSEN